VDCFILQGSTKRGDHLDYLKNDLSSHSALWFMKFFGQK
jgi:hypothetical protein